MEVVVVSKNDPQVLKELQTGVKCDIGAPVIAWIEFMRVTGITALGASASSDDKRYRSVRADLVVHDGVDGMIPCGHYNMLDGFFAVLVAGGRRNGDVDASLVIGYESVLQAERQAAGQLEAVSGGNVGGIVLREFRFFDENVGRNGISGSDVEAVLVLVLWLGRGLGGETQRQQDAGKKDYLFHCQLIVSPRRMTLLMNGVL